MTKMLNCFRKIVMVHEKNGDASLQQKGLNRKEGKRKGQMHNMPLTNWHFWLKKKKEEKNPSEQKQ